MNDVAISIKQEIMGHKDRKSLQKYNGYLPTFLFLLRIIYFFPTQVYMLAEGMCIYHGSSENTVPYLASIGLQCPMYHNPADYSK